MKADDANWTRTIIRYSRNEYIRLMVRVPLEQRQKNSTLKTWSIKDELIHLVFWLEVFLANIQAQKNGKALIDTSNYLAMNDQTWLERHEWTWQRLEKTTEQVFANLESELIQMDVRQFLLAGEPLAKLLVYELFTHSLHHFEGIYKKLGLGLEHQVMLKRVLVVLERRSFSRFTANTRKKILGDLEASAD